MPDFSQMTQSQVAEFFAGWLAKIYTDRTAGDFTFIGVLFKFDRAMAEAKV